MGNNNSSSSSSCSIMSILLHVCFLLLTVVSSVSCVKCKAGTPTLGKLTKPNLPDVECKGPSFEDLCYVMFTDYDNDNYDAWTYGCILKGSLNKCDKSFRRSGVTNNYCCCTTPLCNTMEFARKCGSGGSGGDGSEDGSDGGSKGGSHGGSDGGSDGGSESVSGDGIISVNFFVLISTIVAMVMLWN